MNGCGCFDPAVFGHIHPCPLGVLSGMCEIGTGPCTCRACAERRQERNRLMRADAAEVPF